MSEPATKKLKLGGAASGAKLEKFEVSKHAAMLGLPLSEPIVPERPSEKDIIAGRAPELCDWIEASWKSVVFRLSALLFECPTTKLRDPLYLQRTPAFDAASGASRASATTFKEPWVMENCLKSLRNNGMYEASMTVWQFISAAKQWNGIDLGTSGVSWKQYDACAGLWRKAALASSSEHSDKERYIFPGFLLTCVKSAEAIEEALKANSFFRDLPACGGQAVLWSLIGAFNEALGAGDTVQVNKLYEASVTVTVRMRLAPSKAQVRLDQMTFIDVLRQQHLAAGATSFCEFAWALLDFEEITGQESGPELVKKLETLGVTFKGKNVEKNLCYTILGLVGIADAGAGKSAIRYLERINGAIFSDHTKVQRTCQVIKKNCAADEWKDAVVHLMEVMGVALIGGDAEEEDFTVDYLVPRQRRQAGYVQGVMARRKFFKWFMDEQIATAASGASNAISTTGLMLIKEKCSSTRLFWWNFHDDEITEDGHANFQ